MNNGQIVSVVLGFIAVALLLGAAREIHKARDLLEEQEIAAARDDWMAVADSVQRHPSGMQRLCPPPRGPEDDPDFIASLRRQP